MVDEPGQGAKDTAQGTIFNSDIGDDWGEAFEAEDFMASPKEEASREFFLPDEATAGTAPPPPVAALSPGPIAPVSVHGRIPSLLHSLVDRFRKTPLPLRLALLVIPLVGVALTLTLARLHKGPAPEPGSLPATTAAPPPAEAPAAHPPEPPADGHEAASKPVAIHEEVAPPPPPEPRTFRTKWRFPAIIVRAKAEPDQTPIILTTDMTLVLKLGPESTPPTERESFVRDLLYQFYTNQPPEDLRRYALARGEMTRKLQAWIVKQWPELPLDSIAIDRYQLL